jgi:Xaa-Pro aminopeptidase
MNLQDIQSALRERRLDAWLFYDHHHRDPIAYRVLTLPDKLMVTRRWFYVVPMEGEPTKLVHRIEAGHLDSLPGSKRAYSSWQELQGGLQTMLAPYRNIAMQYSPNNQIPYVGLVDAGTVELVRSFGKNVVSSGDLVSIFEAVLTEEQIASHYAARDVIDRVTAAAFQQIGRRVRNGGTNEFEMHRWMVEAMKRDGIFREDGPIVGVNAHSGDPHYEPTAEHSSPIREGDFVLLDIWGKKNDPAACYYDITWTGFVGKNPSDRYVEIFNIVRDARDVGVKTVQAAFATGRKICGWEVDKAVRDFITEKGYGEFFVHRTGHNISTAIHGNGANIDNLETKDEREILPYTCFSIEPGIYLPGEFGVRSEVNMLTGKDKAEVTGREQTELVLI